MQELSLIVSTGRTGTQFFEYFINKYCANATCLHEPQPSRRFKFFSNMFLQNMVSRKFIAKHYTKSREKILKGSLNNKYIESNNFLFGCITPLQLNYNVKVLHIIREPKSYIQSHLKHGFWSGHKRFFAKYIPYWLEKININKKDKNNPVKILANRWVYVNKTISNYSKTTPYLALRFEDLFSDDIELAKTTLNSAIEFLGIKTNEGIDLVKTLKEKQNIGTKKKIKNSLIESESIYINNVCKELMIKFNYNR